MLDAESLEEIVGYSHRKEEISDIKFSPGNQFKVHILLMGDFQIWVCIGNKACGIKDVFLVLCKAYWPKYPPIETIKIVFYARAYTSP